MNCHLKVTNQKSRSLKTWTAVANRIRKAAMISLAIIAVVAYAPAQAADPVDSWTGQDKLMHVGISGSLGILGVGLADRLGFTGRVERIAVGAAIGMIPGVAKEWSDRYNPRGTASGKDMVANMIGAIVGASISDCCAVRALASRRDRIDGLSIDYRIEF